jgi:hypothetical protein
MRDADMVELRERLIRAPAQGTPERGLMSSC